MPDAEIRWSVWVPRATFALMMIGVLVALAVLSRTRDVSDAAVRNEVILRRVEAELEAHRLANERAHGEILDALGRGAR